MAAIQHILPGRLEVLGVPWVCHIAGMGGVIHQEGHLADIVAAAQALHRAQMRTLHADQQVIIAVILRGQLAGRLALAADAVLSQLLAGRRIHGVAELLPAGSRRFDMKL